MTINLVIVGATGIGKSQLACQVALKINGEVINTDSRQVYKGMDIGTAKPTQDQMTLAKHHLYSVIDPMESFDLHLFQDLAISAKLSIKGQGKVPIFVGGTGQYIWSLVEGWKLTETNTDIYLRKELESQLKDEGLSSLVKELKKRFPESLNGIDVRNPRRVVRALEKGILGHAPVTIRPKNMSSLKDWFIVGLTTERPKLYKAVDCRLVDMIEAGWLSEVSQLADIGLTPDIPSMETIGYPEIYHFLQRKKDWSETVSSIKSRTHRLIRSQYNWFKLSDSRIDWYDVGEMDIDQITERVSGKIIRKV